MGLIDLSEYQMPDVDRTGLRTLDIAPEKASFVETWKATIGRLDPVISQFDHVGVESHLFPSLNYTPDLLVDDPEFDVVKAVFDLDASYHEYSSNLLLARNADHFDFLVQKLDESKARDEILQNSTIGNMLLASLFDPVNLVSLPVGISRTALGTGVNVAKANMAFTAVEDALIASVDPNRRDLGETTLNVGMSGMVGFALGGLTGLVRNGSAGEVSENVARGLRDEQQEINRIVEEGMAIVDESFDRSQRLSAFGPVGDQAGIGPIQTVEAPADPSTVRNPFTTSVFNKILTSPDKRTQLNEKVPISVKQAQYNITGDMGQLADGHRNGQVLGVSVYAEQAQYTAEVHQFYMRMMKHYQNAGGEVNKFLDYAGVMGPFSKKHRDFNKFMEQAGKRYVENKKPRNQFEEQVFNEIKNFNKVWEDRLTETGQIGSLKFFEKNLDFWNEVIRRNEAILRDPKNKKLWYRNAVKSRLAEYKSVRENIKEQIEFLRTEDVKPPNEDNFFARYFKQDKIRKNKEDFIRRVADWYYRNPKAIVFDPLDSKKRVEVKDRSYAGAVERATKTYERIVKEGEGVPEFEDSYFGMGKSKHFMHRTLDIPNSLISDYIETNPLIVMQAYNQKVAPRYSFEKKFGGRSIKQVKDDAMDDMVREGMSEKEINKVLRDMQVSYQRVMNAPLRNPQRWDAKTARIVKDFAQFNYMGAVGMSSIPEFGRIMAEHGVGKTMTALKARYLDDIASAMIEEGKKSGEAVEGAFYSTQMRFADEMMNNPLHHSLWEQGKEAFYILNGLTPITRMLKNLDAMVRQDSLISYAIREAAGDASEMERNYLRRYGISKADALKLADNNGSAWQRGDSGLIYANTDEWTDLELKTTFQRAMSSGILNTIMNATPADKPILNDGVVFIPMNIAKRFGMTEDPDYRGYARIESMMLGLPFQFYSYSLAAINKTTQAYTTGQLKSPIAGTLIMMGLGYASLELKSWLTTGSTIAWDNVPMTDKLMRAFDQSGAIAFYSDMLYTSIATSMALSGENYLDGFIGAKFPEEQGFFNAVNQFAGAGPSIVQDYTETFTGLIRGEEGSVYDAIKHIPGMKLWFMRTIADKIHQSLEGVYDDEQFIGYGRY